MLARIQIICYTQSVELIMHINVVLVMGFLIIVSENRYTKINTALKISTLLDWTVYNHIKVDVKILHRVSYYYPTT